MSGEPINEPIVSHGLLVMNTRKEIMNAYGALAKGSLAIFNTIQNKII